MLKNTLMACFALALVVGMTSCGGKKISAKTKKLMNKRWVYDAEATRAEAGKAINKSTGIKNASDVTNLKGDVKKIGNFLMNHTLQIYKSKKGKLAWQRTKGKGVLSSKVRGFFKWKDKEENEMILLGYNGKGKDATFKIETLTDGKLVLINEIGAKKIYNRK
ncbi:hypothetical protein [uncultured Microscilla sp.]|uniref:hypothetical protein n=1 Tax=uncultured Microscilla sp. TaxID=432653 RepID=UPI0026024D6A|nr:hypothetical protein [uncultured Microscilla sp.]